jgi:ubiquitin-activating enzyme E1
MSESLSPSDTSSSSPPKKLRKTEHNSTTSLIREKLNGSSSSASEANGTNNVVVDSAMSQGNDEKIDESLYSRQLYVLGEEAMKKMSKSSVLIAGLGPTGVEAAKNIILGGVKKVTLWDNGAANWLDLGAQFYLNDSHVKSGANRAAASLAQLKELNPYVQVELLEEDELTDLALEEHNVLLVTDTLKMSSNNEESILALGDRCRAKSTSLIIAEAAGLGARLFCDFGERHTVVDRDGAEPKSVLIASVVRVDKTNEFAVACHDEVRHDLESGDWVKFTELSGLDNFLERDFKIARTTGPFSFVIEAEGVEGERSATTGWVTEVKKPIEMSFNPLRKSIEEPGEFLLTDFGKFERPATFHACFRSLYYFAAKYGALPKPHDENDADNFVTIAKGFNPDLEVEPARKFAFTCRAQLQPVTSVIGAVAAQEAVKAVSGKFTPTKQWWYLCMQECLVNKVTDAAMTEDRYCSQTACFGAAFQATLLSHKWFMVGSGAIGCELLKNFAMMGIGNIVVTDMDTIERSNLNRQFLFRSWDVGKHKAQAAAAAVMRMNPDVKVESQNTRVGEDSQDVYTDDFMEGLTGVANALDNVDARLYMDRRCVYYRLPLLESGTLGTMGNTQVVIPGVTESYGSSRDPPEKSIPICTLKNFPNAIEHCLQWARDEFEGIFTGNAGSALQYLNDPDDFIAKTRKLPGNEPLTTSQAVLDFLVTKKPANFDECIEWARGQFEERYVNQIKQLLHNFPPDQKTSTGAPFWSGPKRCPKALSFDADNATHREYVIAAAHLHAENYHIGANKMSNDELVKKAAAIKVTEFVAKKVKIAVTDQEAQQERDAGSIDADELEKYIKQLPSDKTLIAQLAKAIEPADFEKDDDSNRHIDFIVACSNLRAENYGIEPADRSKSKRIAGRIIPAIATTTAMVAGLISAELYKIAAKCDDIEKYRNTFMNLALPVYSFSEPMPAPKNTYCGDKTWTLWDRFDIDGRKADGGEMTVGELIDYFKNEHKLEMQMLSSGVTLLYSFFIAPAKKKERLAMKISDAVKTVGKREIGAHEKYFTLDICVNDEEDEDQEVPYVRYRFRN